MNYQDHNISLGLKRIRQVADKLDLPVQSKIILVAGTNGKGTTVAAIDSIYRTAGFSVGTYTSPHLIDFNERIQVNGQKITDEELYQTFSVVRQASAAIALTYFELATLAALIHFSKHNLDILIFEVGLGGRLDATNILTPDITIITTIDYDHQKFLGNDLEQIGFEKAGILRLNKPLIYADINPPLSILAAAYALSCPLYINGKHYHIHANQDTITFDYADTSLKLPQTPWHYNAIAAALMVTQYWQDSFPITTFELMQGINSMTLFGRQQFIDQKEITTCLDVSHNMQSVKYLADNIYNKLYCNQYNQVHAVFSALNDKDIPSMIYSMQHLVDRWYPALLASDRAAATEQLLQAFLKNGIMITQFYTSPAKAYQEACNQAKSGDLIIVYGSFLTVSSVWTLLLEQA